MAGILREQSFTEVEELFQQSFSFDRQVIYFPVRHHSPACALHLMDTIETYRPDIILIEGPSDSGQLLPYISDSNSEAPFCIYYSYDDKNGKISEEKEKYRAYYPFLDYSPELVAIRQGDERKILVRFIDLPYALRLINKTNDAEPQYYYNENKEYEVNTYTSMIAARAGCRSFAEFWESRYELGAAELTTEAFVRNVFYLGYFMRSSTPENESSFREDILREQYMAEEIRKASTEYQRILVVAGAFHIAGLMESVKANTTLSLKPCNPDHVASYLMPYTFKEADSKSGYAAGMPFPAFYQEIWSALRSSQNAERKTQNGKKSTAIKDSYGVLHSAFSDVVLSYIIKTARYARKTQSISLPDEINAFTMANSLATLRGKQCVGVYELLDGVKSSFVKGDINATSTFEIDFLQRLLSGMGAGRVAANDMIPPVVREFRSLCAFHRLKTSTVERQDVTLDIIKNPAHFKKSRFLHQLEFLKTGFCTLQSGPDYVNRRDKNLVREIWYCRYSTQVETQLIDLSVYGASLSQVCASLIEKEFKDSMTAEELGKLLISVQVMGIENFYIQYEDAIRQVISGEKNFVNLCKLIGSLHYLKDMQRLMNGEDGIEWLIPEFARIAFKEAVELITVIKQAEEDEEQIICEQMRNLYNFSLDNSTGFDVVAFHEAVEKVLADSFSNSRLFGLCLAIHYKEGEEQERFAEHISSYLESCINHPEQAASFICGLFLIARDVLFTDERILIALDKIIGNVPQEQFLSILPNLRYAFTMFLPGELNRLGKNVATYHQIDEGKLSGSIMVSQKEVELGMQLDKIAADALNIWNL